jgi:hypothetical protein
MDNERMRMTGDASNITANGLAYVATFKEKCFDEKCDVEVVTDVVTREAKVLVTWAPVFGTSFQISIDDLQRLSVCVASAKAHADLLHESIPESLHHRLCCTIGGASLIVIHPKDKLARFALTIGTFHREGKLDALSSEAIDEVVARLEVLKLKVIAKIDATTRNDKAGA